MPRTSGEGPSGQQKTRIEISFPGGARELEDLSRVAERIRGNPQRRGEASAYIIRLWSQVVHGEISVTAFWEIFGVSAPASTSSAAPDVSPSPSIGREASMPPSVQEQEGVQTEVRRVNRERNRAAAADQWAQ